jgi:hypothetical protein
MPERCPVGKVSENESADRHIFLGLYLSSLSLFQISKCESGSKSIDVSKDKNMFTLARGGPIRTRVLVEHDNVSVPALADNLLELQLCFYHFLGSDLLRERDRDPKEAVRASRRVSFSIKCDNPKAYSCFILKHYITFIHISSHFLVCSPLPARSRKLDFD